MGLRTKQKSAKVIAVDFDGTIVEHRFPNIGPASPGAFMYLCKWKALGIKLILWTMRDGDYLKDAVDWCRKAGLEFDAVNEGIDDRNWTTSNKAYADVYIDDMAIGCPMANPDMVDWYTVGPMVEERLGIQEDKND